MFINSPLEQFVLLPIFPFLTPYVVFVITNIIITAFYLFIFFSILILSFSVFGKSNFYLISSKWRRYIERNYIKILSFLDSNIQIKNKYIFFPLFSFNFFIVLYMNTFGILPFTYAITSQFIITLSIAVSLFLAMNTLSIIKHKIKFFSSFLPSGVSVILAFLLVPIELISFIFKPVSLAIRLFVNIVAGHTMLKIIAGFVLIIMSCVGFFSVSHLFPLILIIALFFLEVAVAFIQAFVFSILLCIYLNDLYNLH
jgi:ATP synthase subunit 6